MRFGILGPTGVWRPDGSEVVISGRRLRALLARLLLEPGRLVSAATLIDGLYGEQPPTGAANALQSQVSRLRRALREPAQVEYQPAGYRLAVAPDQVDAHRFTRLAAEGHRALAAGDRAGAAKLLREALDLWRGPALADVADAPFAPGQAARLARARLAALEDRLEADLSLGAATAVVPELQELVAAHPLRERLVGQLMRALAGSGRPAEALAVFADARHRLAEELGADPSPELAAVHRSVLRAGTPELADPPVPRRELPAQLTSFVGRDHELRRLGELLSGGARLVTLTGPGGAGKTRLAVEAAGRHGSDTCLVELATLGVGADVPYAVLAALGLRDAGLRVAAEGRPSPADRLAAALTDRRLLLVLDNCEQVVSQVAALADRLLRACPVLRILATSREPLGLTGEVLVPLSGLAVPAAGAPPDGGPPAPAVRLFVDRAADVLAGFRIDDSNRDAVGRICRMLDGLPLAIELAAARLRSLPVGEVADRLDDRFTLLSRGSRTAQPRHRTLRSVMEWSWDLLDVPEQELARRLSVFAGGATLEAVERVAGDGPGSVELLSSLVDRSLVEVADGRYRMLHTVRAYAAERLAAAGEGERLRRAHAEYYLDLAWRADRRLRRAEQLTWLARLDVERENLHAALRAAASAGDVDTALELTAALSTYWWLRGQRGEAAASASGVLAVLPGEPPAGRAEEYALCVLNAALGGTVDPAVRRRLAGATAVVQALRRPPRQPALYLLSALATGPPAEGEAAVTAAQSRMGFGDDPWAAALRPLGTGYIRLWAGRATEAAPSFEEALAAFRGLGERWGMTNALAGLAEIADRHGDRDRAVALIDEALGHAAELGSAADTADLLRLRADSGVRAGALDRAEADYRAAAASARRAGALDTLAAARLGLAELARLRGTGAESRRLAEAALADCPSGWFTADEVRASLLTLLGRLAEAAGEPAAARDYYRRAVTGSAGVPGLFTPTEAAEGLRRLH